MELNKYKLHQNIALMYLKMMKKKAISNLKALITKLQLLMKKVL